MTRALATLALALTLSACAANTDEDASLASNEPPRSSAEPAPEPRATEQAQERDKPIGYLELPPAIPQEVLDANSKALVLHRAGNYERSAAGFYEATRWAPQYGIAAFNLACARARLGDLAEAARILEDLLDEDMPQYAPKFSEDADLEALRRSAEGAKLRARIDALRVRWKQAAQGGLPAILWRGHRAPAGTLVSRFVRPGVYQHDTKRFVPLGSNAPKLAGAILDLQSERALLIHADIPARCTADFCPRLNGYDVQVAALFGEANSGPKKSASDDGSKMISAVSASFTGAAFRYDEASGSSTGWIDVNASGSSRRAADQHLPEGPWIRVAPSGSLLGRTERGFTITGRDLVTPEGDHVPLDARHAGADMNTILLSADRSTILVLSVHSRCVCQAREGSELSHVLSRIERKTARVEVVLAEAGASSMAMDTDGALYLQQGTKMVRWPKTLPRTAPEPLEEGILLTTPDFGPSNCCGL